MVVSSRVAQTKYFPKTLSASALALGSPSGCCLDDLYYIYKYFRTTGPIAAALLVGLLGFGISVNLGPFLFTDSNVLARRCPRRSRRLAFSRL